MRNYFYYNYEYFDSENYGNKSVKRVSKIDIENIHIDTPT